MLAIKHLSSTTARLRAALAASVMLLPAAQAADLEVNVQIPRLDVAEYHRPYVAVWIENPDQSVATQLAVWYQTDPKKEDGTQWLKDLRQWWRRGGRELSVPIDGVTGATRAVGDHKLSFKSQSAALSNLAPGKYAVVVEAVREVGGRELLRVSFDWPAQAKQHAEAQGKSELGLVTVHLNP
jgi:hypothetical protein